MYLRPSKHSVFMDIAASLAQLGTCDRKRVGAVFVRDGRCITWGYNGAPPGMPHCEENNHGWLGHAQTHFKHAVLETPEQAADRLATNVGCRNATHAEANALAFAARQGISTEGATLYVTVSPCETCSRLLIAAGIREVRYEEEYRDRSGIELLERAGLIFQRGIYEDD